MELYHKTSYQLSKKITNAYSTSFSWGIRAFSPEYREPIYAIYGFVRIADEIVDTFHDFNKEALLKDFREETYKAIDEGVSTNPVLHSFQKTVKEYNIDRELIDNFLNSMEMDLDNNSHERHSYDNYVDGSAEAVGLMCLKVFCKGSQELYNELEYPARMLGAAFQKVNFLRDIKSDVEERGRIYLPGVHELDYANNDHKKALEDEVEKEFHAALEGIKKLPAGVKLGVYSAYLYFYILFRKIRKADLNELMEKRVRVSNFNKLLLLLKSYVKVKFFKLS
jgi:phytoene/squalene synthetase